mmetsp:Transcript_112418/g.176931  ORF Transcript_112418/g.176931 Transcript_112418/m.176931 type:complete len:124 (-) Transcript_112418:269-640(-)
MRAASNIRTAAKLPSRAAKCKAKFLDGVWRSVWLKAESVISISAFFWPWVGPATGRMSQVPIDGFAEKACEDEAALEAATVATATACNSPAERLAVEAVLDCDLVCHDWKRLCCDGAVSQDAL